MKFFKRGKTADGAKPDAADMQETWEALGALSDVQKAAEARNAAANTPDAEPAPSRSTVADDIERYTSMDLTAELGDTPVSDATPGRIDVDVASLLDIPTPAPEQSENTAAAGRDGAAAPGEPVSALDATLSFTPPAAPPRDGRADLGSMRLDVARIAADIQSGEELYRRAQKRIENLTGFVERAELDFSMLNRLEPENRRLKARNRTLESEIDDAKRRVEVMRADLEDHQKRLAERSAVLEQLHGKMSLAQKNLQEYERVLGHTRQNSDKHALAAERAQTSLDVERRENQVLRSKITELTAECDERQTAAVEAQKMTDSMRQDAIDFRTQAESLSTENIELRNALDQAQRANNLMKGEMVSLHEDIRNFKTSSEFNVIAREDEMTAMRQQLDELKKQLEIKDEIVRNAARDVQELRKVRTAQDLERERLESIIETQTFQLEDAGARLIEAQQNVTDFDRRYRDVANALNQQQALRQSSPPSDAPDIMPGNHVGPLHDDAPIAEPLKDPRSELARELESEEIEDRLTDLTLGLRTNL